MYGGGYNNNQPPSGFQPQNGYQSNPPPPQFQDTRAFGGYPGAGGGYPGAGGGYPGAGAPPPPQYGQPQYGGAGGGFQPQGGGYNQGGGFQPQGGGYGQQSYGQQSYAPPPQQQQYGSYQPPTGQPPPHHYHPNAQGYQPPQSSGQYGSYQPPSGPPPPPPTGAQHYGPQFQGPGGKQQPYFQYSNCTGKRKALLIGINYFGQQGQLRGCINDVHNVQKFLMDRYHYRAEDMVILTDDAKNPRQIPTRQNIIQAMQWLVRDARPNDALFFHYSGHGGQVKDQSGDEDDGYDECIYPVDFKRAGHLVDDDMHALMVRPLPAGCRLTAIFDSCHSATALDLPYVYSTEGKIKEPNLLAEAGQGLLGAAGSYLKGDLGGMVSGVFGVGKSLLGGNKDAAEKTRQTRTSPADVIMWSGCKDSQTSADTSEAGKATGAMSFAFIAAMTKNPQQSYVMLLRSIREELRGRYDQKPQLSSSHPIDTNLLFIC
ncbi:hypothetical protein CC85DRAFT_252433 [Cutaneotrichosporon oleaginosum]|uniref:Peptidase C14 caspase domain-containing protein n=1 Tax=Cutaneotrichosporon oleaginosum TaxID=879819 RepID=A0A0J1ATT9_9TREE|nr:uncharacterized protein CC85DRAFT_252433 [Cutaneotrichosporon oleaginosum]KLT38744.1 hypothetical protein CC85DRAFT_252433 [Cutaneotrichosporon oleaginosum]TXT06900.1 hypothetical protein COLE_06231 [Cutaneotrichosporon oleaginosum]